MNEEAPKGDKSPSKAEEGRARAQRPRLHTSEGEKVKRASAWFWGNTWESGTDSSPDQGSEVDALACSMELQLTHGR
jgi:hypothetical protein